MNSVVVVLISGEVFVVFVSDISNFRIEFDIITYLYLYRNRFKVLIQKSLCYSRRCIVL